MQEAERWRERGEKKEKNVKDTDTAYVEWQWERSWRTHGNGNTGLFLYNTLRCRNIIHPTNTHNAVREKKSLLP